MYSGQKYKRTHFQIMLKKQKLLNYPNFECPVIYSDSTLQSLLKILIQNNNALEGSTLGKQ